MTQTIVNFLTQNTSGVLSVSSRVFDYAIGSIEQTIYLNLMEDLQAAITADDDDKIAAIVNQLNNWSKLKESTLTNVTVNQTLTISDLRNPPTTKTWTTDNPVTTMNRGMAEAVDKIIRTLRSAGWDPTTTAAGASALTALATIKANASIYPLVQYVTDGINQANGAVLNTGVQDISGTSLQQMLMVDYVSRGNDLLFNEMTGLSNAIESNQTALSYLNSLQDLMNQKDPQAFLLALDKISGVYSGGMSASKYSEFEKASFDQELGTTAKFTEAQISTYLAQLFNPTYSTDVTSLSTDAQALATKLVPQTSLQSLLGIVAQWPLSLEDSGAVSTFQTRYAEFMAQLQTVQSEKNALLALKTSYDDVYWYEQTAVPISTLSTRLSSLQTAITSLDTKYSALSTVVNNLKTAAASDATYHQSLTNAWSAIATTALNNSPPSQFFGTSITNMQTGITNALQSFNNAKEEAITVSLILSNYTNAANDLNTAVQNWPGGWVGWDTERAEIANKTSWVQLYKNSLASAITDFTNAVNNPNTSVGSFYQLCSGLSSASNNLKNALNDLISYAQDFHDRMGNPTWDYQISVQIAINTLNMYSRDPLITLSSYATTGRTASQQLSYPSSLSDSTLRAPITTAGTNLANTLIPPTPGFIGSDLSDVSFLVYNWPEGLADPSNTKETFLSTYTTFMGQISSFNAVKQAYVTAVASSTNPSTTLISAANNLISAIEAMTTTYQTLASSANTLLDEAASNPTYHADLALAVSKVFTTDMANKTPAQWTPTISNVKSVFSKMQSASEGSAAGSFVSLQDGTTTFTNQLARIKSNLSYLITNLNTTSGATSLSTSLQTVLDDFNGIAKIEDWVKDYAAANQGSYQTHLNNSIVASQALNDAKREDLRRVMFIFEEFYKSATSMLSRLTQLIERMASAINR